MNFTRELLWDRHRLSHQQIDDVLGESQSKLFIQDKLKQLSDLKVFFELSDRFIQEEISILHLKGPVLSQRIYGDPTYRYYRDFDIMVSPEEVGNAFSILIERGFNPNYFDWPESKRKQKAIIKYINQTSFYHPEHGITLELHWKLFHREYLERKEEEKLIQENTTLVLISGREFKTLSPELDLVFLVIHGGLHAWARLKWLLDIHEFINRVNFNRDQLLHFVKLFRVENYFALVDALLRHNFQNPKLQEYQVYLKPYTFRYTESRINSGSPNPYDDQKSFWGYYRFLWLLSPNRKFFFSLFRFSSFKREEVEHPYLPLHPLSGMGLRMGKKVFGRS
jgi:hypothetical protein